jgi:hypothetical protein
LNFLYFIQYYIAKNVTKLITWYIDKNGVQFDLNFGLVDLMDLWETFLNPSDSYFLFADLVGFYTH